MLDALSVQLLFNGLTLGASYGLLALGFALTLRAAGAINFAHGDVAVVGAYAAVAAGALGLGGGWSIALAGIIGGASGLLVAALAWAPLRHRPIEATFIAAIAIGIIIQNGLAAGFGGAPQAVSPLGAGGAQLGSLYISSQSAWVICISGAAFALTAYILKSTQTGRRLRAAAEDPEIAAVHGIPVIQLAVWTFIAAGILAGLAGALLANHHYVTPHAGADYILKAYIAATAAGWGRILPAAVAALIIALFETIGAAIFSHAVAEGALYAGFVLLLAFRPQGLAGEATGRRA
ncbi:MAG: branched-chain amino acid ABC transporter permease [Alphaproteobacteria bacterium]